MLTSLYIENIAVIEKSNIELTGGLNILTGETGAGKSIVIDAINAVMGQRTSKEIIRNGCENATVFASFTGVNDIIRTKLRENGYDFDEDELVLSRTLSLSGKNNCRINGKPCTVGLLRELGINLINIHGQHESYELFSPETHITYIDNLAENSELLNKYKEAFGEYRRLKKELEAFKTSESNREQRIDILSYQVEELDNAGVEVGEMESLADEINGGFCREVVLIRYLNACGLTKDSVGVWAMTEDDVRAVERGVENPVYESGNPLRKMVYVMLFERENWVHTGTVSGFTMLQRFELWRATWKVIKENPWVGVGTGDAVDAMHAELVEMDSELIGTTKRTHNEYLSLVAMVGFLGVAVLAVMFLRAVVRPKHLKNKTKHLALIVAWLIVVLVSFLTEDTLDTLAGILFCTWFLAFRPKTIK